jgi:hypothetical protein
MPGFRIIADSDEMDSVYGPRSEEISFGCYREYYYRDLEPLLQQHQYGCNLVDLAISASRKLRIQ